MTISEKWSALFHNVLQREQSVTPAIAREALALIGWISGKWAEIQKAEGYYDPDGDLVRNVETVMAALGARSCDEPLPALWPSDILIDWGLNNPFLPVIGEEIFKRSDWEPLYEVLQTSMAQPDSHSARTSTSLSPVWIIASANPLRKAWEKVLRVLLPGDGWLIQGYASIAALPGTTPSVAHSYLLFGSQWDAQAQVAALEVWQQQHGGSFPVTVINTTSVAEAIEQIAENQS